MERKGLGEGRSDTFSIAAFTIGLVINPFLNKFSINSLFVRPEHDQAMFWRGLVPRMKLRRECSLLVVGLDA
jgi:hypothetical protein